MISAIYITDVACKSSIWVLGEDCTKGSIFEEVQGVEMFHEGVGRSPDISLNVRKFVRLDFCQL